MVLYDSPRTVTAPLGIQFQAFWRGLGRIVQHLSREAKAAYFTERCKANQPRSQMEKSTRWKRMKRKRPPTCVQWPLHRRALSSTLLCPVQTGLQTVRSPLWLQLHMVSWQLHQCPINNGYFTGESPKSHPARTTPCHTPG